MANTKVSFDAATFADAIQKAARVAPTKGAAFDVAQGILVTGYENQVEIKSTNLDTSYLQRIVPTEAKCPNGPFSWRIPSIMLAGLVSNLPLGSGASISLIDTGDGAIRLSSGTVKVKLAMITGDLPKVEWFDPENFSSAQDFAHKAGRVSWASDTKSNGVLNGVHIDGESLIATDREGAAIVPCQVPIKNPITVPLWNIANVLKAASDVRLNADDKTLQIMLDADSQATSRIYEGAFPDVKRVLRDEFAGHAIFPKSQFVEAINRMLIVAKSEKMPVVKLTFDAGITKYLTLDVEVPETGQIRDTLDIDGEYDDLFEIYFTPTRLIQAIDNVKGENAKLYFGQPGLTPAQNALQPVVVKDDSGYTALVMPRKA